MTGGETALLIGGGVLLVGAAWLAFRHTSSVAAVAPVATLNPGQTYATSAPALLGAPPPAPSATAQLAAGINGLNEAGCSIAASKIGVGGSLAAMGCSDFLKYATPIGAAEIVNQKVLTKIPGVATAENAVSSVANKSVSAVKGAVSSVLSFL